MSLACPAAFWVEHSTNNPKNTTNYRTAGVRRPSVDTLEQHRPPFLPGEERLRPQHFADRPTPGGRRGETRRPRWRCQRWRKLQWRDEGPTVRAGRGGASTSDRVPVSSRGARSQPPQRAGVLVFQLFEAREEVPHMAGGLWAEKCCRHRRMSDPAILTCCQSFFSVAP